MTRIIVTGGRDFTDAACVDRVLDTLHQEQPITVLATGAARGADRLAEEWAERKMPRVHLRSYPADWGKHGRAAGPVRNGRMLDEERAFMGGVRIVVAFPGGRGTEDCIRQAKARGLVVCRVVVDGTTTSIVRDTVAA